MENVVFIFCFTQREAPILSLRSIPWRDGLFRVTGFFLYLMFISNKTLLCCLIKPHILQLLELVCFIIVKHLHFVSNFKVVIREKMVGYGNEEQVLGGVGSEDLSLSHPDPVVLELNRLQNLLKGLPCLIPKYTFYVHEYMHWHAPCVSACVRVCLLVYI